MYSTAVFGFQWQLAQRKSSWGGHKGHCRGFIGKFVWAHIDRLSLVACLRKLTFKERGQRSKFFFSTNIALAIMGKEKAAQSFCYVKDPQLAWGESTHA